MGRLELRGNLPISLDSTWSLRHHQASLFLIVIGHYLPFCLMSASVDALRQKVKFGGIEKLRQSE